MIGLFLMFFKDLLQQNKYMCSFCVNKFINNLNAPIIKLINFLFKIG